MLLQRKMLSAIKTSSFFPLKMHVGEKIEIITEIVHILKLYETCICILGQLYTPRGPVTISIGQVTFIRCLVPDK